MSDLNHMYVEYLITQRLNGQMSAREASTRRALFQMETVRSRSSVVASLRRLFRLATPRPQVGVDVSAGTPVSTAFLAAIQDCVS